MKKALLLALAALFAAVAPALAHPPANVNFASESGVPFGLVLDGRPLTRGVARQVHVDQLAPGVHWADFTVPTAYGGAVRFRSRVWLEPGLETTFVLIARPGWPLDLRQVNAVAVYGRGYGGRGYGNGYNGGGYYNSPAPYGQGNSPYNNSPYNNGSNGPGYGTPNNGNGSPGGYNNGNDGNNNNGSSPDYGAGPAVNNYRTLAPQDVDALLQTLRSRPFEATKLSTAKEALNQSSIRADDLARLLQSFNAEASRVELAKYAYAHVVDPQDFDRVYEAFQFEASVREVQQAIANAPRN